MELKINGDSDSNGNGDSDTPIVRLNRLEGPGVVVVVAVNGVESIGREHVQIDAEWLLSAHRAGAAPDSVMEGRRGRRRWETGSYVIRVCVGAEAKVRILRPI